MSECYRCAVPCHPPAPEGAMPLCDSCLQEEPTLVGANVDERRTSAAALAAGVRNEHE
jgi:hypothetical protein